jgi:hypothetical protein
MGKAINEVIEFSISMKMSKVLFFGLTEKGVIQYLEN